MKPYYEHKGITIYHGDCLEILPKLNISPNMLLTDPPFGINFKYKSHDDSPDNYGEWLWQRIEIAENLCNPGSIIFIYQAMPNVKKFSLWFPRDYRIFAAAKNFVQMRPCPMQYSYDPCIVWWKEGAKPYSRGTLSRDFHIGNTANTINRKRGYVKGHPCPRPIDQIRHIIYQWSKDDSLILDPFMGSGTSLVAAKELNRKAVGIEIEKEYCEIAIRRLAQEVLNLNITTQCTRPSGAEAPSGG